MRYQIAILIFLIIPVAASIISKPAKATLADFLSVDKSYGYTTDTFTFNVTFSAFPNSSMPFGLEYRTLSSSAWQNAGEPGHVSDFQRNGNSIIYSMAPADVGIIQSGTYDFQVVYGIPDKNTNSVAITLQAGTIPSQQQQESQHLNNFYVLVIVTIVAAFLLVFATVYRLMKSPAENW